MARKPESRPTDVDRAGAYWRVKENLDGVYVKV